MARDLVSGIGGVYADRRVPRIFLLGMMSGFPFVLIGSVLTLWLREEGLSRGEVGLLGLVFSVYAINFLWAPVIDRLSIPFLSRRIGARKAWIVIFQAVIILSVIIWMMLDPSSHLMGIAAAALIIAIASASQDIAIDALRIEQIAPHEKETMAVGAAVAVIGWWSGFKLGGLVVLLVADYLSARGIEAYWQASFVVIIGMMALMNLGLLLIPESSRAPRHQWLKAMVVEPFVSFFRRNGISLGLAILGFIFLFKIGEAFMGKMSLVFYQEMGFSKSDIGLYSKGLGWLTTVAFTLIGGWLSVRSGTVRALFLAGIAMAATNILFSVLFWVGKSTWLFAIAVLIDDLAAAFATVAFVTFISLLVDRNYTATQYALLASLGTIGRTVFASLSGLTVDWLEGDWGIFFIITALMVTPALILLWVLRHQITSLTLGGQSRAAADAPTV